jgi:branched-subunit amino acid transport protein
MNAWITLAAASVLTFALRAMPAQISLRGGLPRSLRHANRFTMPAMMGALATRSIATQVTTSGALPIAIALLAAAPFVVRTRSLSLPLLAGAAAFLVVTGV